MEISLASLFYLAFRILPFILVVYYVISSMIYQQMDALIFLAGLLITSILALMVGLFETFKTSARVGNDKTICYSLSFGKKEMISSLPLSVVIYSYALSYLGIPILHYHRNQSNLPFLIFFPIVLFLDMLWLYLLGCSSVLNIFTAGLVGMTGGLSWSEIVYQSSFRNKQIDSILTNDDTCQMSSTKGFTCVQRTQIAADKAQTVQEMESNILLNSYQYLSKMFSEDAAAANSMLKQTYTDASNGVGFMTQISLSGDGGVLGNNYSVYPGINIKGTVYETLENVTSVQSCQNKCDRDTKCTSFVHNTRTGTCTLNNGLPENTNSNITTDLSCSLYLKNSSAFFSLPGTAVKTATPFGNGVTKSSMDCASKCLQSDRCQGFMYGTQTGSCSVYDAASLLKSDANGIRTLNMSNLMSDAASEVQVKHIAASVGQNALDTTYKTLEPVRGVSKCMEACFTDPQCVGFSYNSYDPKKQACYLKGKMTKSQANTNYVSYQANPGFICHYGVQYGEIYNTLAVDPMAASDACNADATCVGFQYDASKSMAYLLRSNSLFSTPIMNDKITTWMKKDVDAAALQKFNELSQTSIVGAPVDNHAQYVGTTEKNCAVACLGNPQCVGFVFDSATNKCVLQKKLFGQDVTVTKEVPTMTTYIEQPPGFKTFFNAVIEKNEQTSKSQDNTTPLSCGNLCMNTPGCAGFVYDFAGNKCYTTTSLNGINEQSGFAVYGKMQ